MAAAPDMLAAFAATLSPEAGPRTAAEAYVKAAAEQPGFCVSVLQVATSAGADEGSRVAAALAFKNHVKFRWSPPLPPPEQAALPTPQAMAEAEKDQIKGVLVGLMLSQPPRVAAQLGEALSLVAACDFPDRWPQLLPELVSKLASLEPAVVNGVLSCTDAIVYRFREQYKTVELVKDIKYVLGLLAVPLLELLKATGARLAGQEGQQASVARQLLTTVLHVCRIFYSLNYQELPGAADATDAVRSSLTPLSLQRCSKTTWLPGWPSSRSTWPTATPCWRWRARTARTWLTRRALTEPRHLLARATHAGCAAR